MADRDAEQWGWSYADRLTAITHDTEDNVRAKAAEDWSVRVWRSPVGETTWIEMPTRHPDGAFW